MMELKLTRISSGVEATLGNLFEVVGTDDLSFQCYTLEDQYNEPKVPGETRIPPGRYEIKLRTEGSMHQRYGKRFDWHKGMLHLQDVPGFTFIYIHVGNEDDDSEGCILVGDGQESNVAKRGRVANSVTAYRRLYETILGVLKKDTVWITIEDVA
jgi:hypothetical protein